MQSAKDAKSSFSKNHKDSTAMKKKKSKSSIRTSKAPYAKRVYIYLKVQGFRNIPKTEHQLTLILNADHFNIFKLECNYSTEASVDLQTIRTSKPTFAISIRQDSYEDLDIFSNNPVGLILYKHEPLKPENDSSNTHTTDTENIEEKVEENHNKTQKEHFVTKTALDEKTKKSDSSIKPPPRFSDIFFKNLNQKTETKLTDDFKVTPIAQGYIDLLHFFSQKKAYGIVPVFLYPMKRQSNEPTCRVTWEVYTLLPLLKNINFCNMAFLSLESIYNPPKELREDHKNLTCSISFQSKIPNKKNEYDKSPFCKFNTFYYKLIVEQNFNRKWEALTVDQIKHENGLGTYTGSKVHQNRMFRNLFVTENFDINYDIITDDDKALVCNLGTRFVLTENLIQVLTDVAAFNEQELLLEIYKKDKPDKVLYEGIINLSVFLYPDVNAIRNAVVLNKSYKRQSGTLAQSKTTLQRKSINKSSKEPTISGQTSLSRQSLATSESATGIPFAILSICLLMPLTNATDPISYRRNLEYCKGRSISSILLFSQISEDYKQFDDEIKMLISFIVEKNVKEKSELNNYCSQVENIVNKVFKLISCDFNVRFPTKTNADFTNMMTIVYKELTNRIYDVVQKTCTDKNDPHYYDDQKKVIKFINIIKFMFESGNEAMGELLFEKLKQQFKRNTCLHFYIFLHNFERNNFEDCKIYFERGLSERDPDGEYIAKIIKVYIDYMNALAEESPETEFVIAQENLINGLNELMTVHQQVDVMVLLYSLYKRVGYSPGAEFLRWRIQNILKPAYRIPKIPLSLWEIHCRFDLTSTTVKETVFHNVVKFYLKFGLYKFAEIVFKEISCSNPNERYFLEMTLKVLLKEVDQKTEIQNIQVPDTEESSKIKLLNAQLSGSLEYSRGNLSEALHYYAEIIKSTNLENFVDFQLALFRYGFQMRNQKNYQKAMEAFKKCQENCLVSNFEIGKAYYWLNNYELAEKYLGKATEHKMHIPDIWAFLALVNIKSNQILKALYCWQYAKLNPENVIGEEIMNELGKIDPQGLLIDIELLSK